ncbi:histidine phosphotransferase family protein [Alloyangia pacifica]|uniref:Histidine phosphotransferase ChpT n=1 Tax=Alloyangia pacifica TaxID=311180 RepID=A0A1I6P0K9_9RHOB|nr:histidine phosphotransferase family protein [Alloyangia pacifica]SDH54826.1 histidine phosphotransferase ChpT [Alloyangia pacifica]SFS33756.1 histidine phosphotransferase ChpT [Alloyangia pacifica]
MQQLNAKLATLVASRLCHDLVSPIGAIANGLELLTLSGSPLDTPELALINESCTAARARISLFRVAFGHAEGEQMIGASEAGRLLRDYCQGGRLSCDWRRQSEAPRPEVQLALLAVLCCESALPMGGQVIVEELDNGWRVTGTGKRVACDTAVWALLARPGKLPALSGAQVHFPIFAALAEARGRSIAATTGEAAVTIEIS